MTGLEQLLLEWLPAQRWFGGKGRALSGVAVERVAALSADPVLELAVVRVETADTVDRYQVLLGRADPAGDGFSAGAAGVVGELDGALLLDAAHDPAALGVLLQLLASGGERDGIAFTSTEPVDPDLTGRVMGAEQSNTSVVYGNALILKLFRRLQAGENPDLEVTRALAEAGSTHVPRPVGWLTGQVDGVATTLGLLQPFLSGSSEGWAMATASVRDLFAEGDLRADEVGGDFAGEAERLGAATGEVHEAMAAALPTGTAGPAEHEATARQLHERLSAALAVVPELAPHADALHAAYDRVAEQTRELTVQRVHGDLHLGQVLRTADGWVLLDFEGEPARPLIERTALMHPLRDVAGMLRSFDYAAHYLLAEQGTNPQLAYRALEWAERNRSAFADGYARASGHDPRSEPVLLRAFELDKAVYEVVYEARNRPTWLPIPLASITRILQEESA